MFVYNITRSQRFRPLIIFTTDVLKCAIADLDSYICVEFLHGTIIITTPYVCVWIDRTYMLILICVYSGLASGVKAYTQ